MIPDRDPARLGDDAAAPRALQEADPSLRERIADVAPSR
jgi:hypothetical protein